MTVLTSRDERRQLDRDNKKQPLVLTEVRQEEWPHNTPLGLSRVLRSRSFLVQIFDPEQEGLPRRLSICRTQINAQEKRWSDGITWDEIQQLKREAGYGSVDAVEIYPADNDVVNVANMRHIFLMAQPLSFAWRKK
jgi:cupin superfamily acireductone dioxygenase involved in methionine salvage